MGICENVQFLCKKRGLATSRLEKELSFANGSIRRWNENSPSIDKIQKVADYFGVTTDFLISGFDKEIIDIIKSLAKTDKRMPYFPPNVLSTLTTELETIKKEYGDVPLDVDPFEIVDLIKRTPLTVEFKEDLLNVLKKVKHKLDEENREIDTIAAHHDGEDWTEDELRDIEKFKEFLRSKRKD